jgi:hypothetical protein
MKYKLSTILVLALTICFSSFSQAKEKVLNDILSKATPAEQNDLPKLLSQIRMKPAANSMMQVTHVEKGSVFDREGIKVGDLIVTNQAKSKKMVLRSSLKSTVNKEVVK